jgi:excisionase family DNA binding protein
MKADALPIGLVEVVKDPSQVSQIDPSQLPVLLTQLSAVQSSIAARLVATSQEGAGRDEDTLLGVEQAAARLGVSEDWLYRRTKRLPFVVHVGRHVRFSSNGIDRYVKNKMGR